MTTLDDVVLMLDEGEEIRVRLEKGLPVITVTACRVDGTKRFSSSNTLLLDQVKLSGFNLIAESLRNQLLTVRPMS